MKTDKRTLDEVIDDTIINRLKAFKHNRTHAAESLCITPSTMRHHVRRLVKAGKYDKVFAHGLTTISAAVMVLFLSFSSFANDTCQTIEVCDESSVDGPNSGCRIENMKEVALSYNEPFLAPCVGDPL